MAFGLFGKRVQEPAAPAAEPQPAKPAAASEIAAGAESDSAREILELLDLELGAMIRQLERPANHAARTQLHHRGRTRWRCRARLCGGCHRGQGARGADPERD